VQGITPPKDTNSHRRGSYASPWSPPHGGVATESEDRSTHVDVPPALEIGRAEEVGGRAAPVGPDLVSERWIPNAGARGAGTAFEPEITMARRIPAATARTR
jgi:hypothetical protein